MARLEPDQLDQIRAQNPIVAVVENHGVELRKRGKYFWGLCPFHNESTASFAVDEVKHRFKCFGCGESGDAISYVMKAKGVDFRTATQELMDLAGLKFEQGPRPKSKRDKDTILACLAWAEVYFQKQLREDKHAQEFAASRGLWTQYAMTWGLGFGPSGRCPLQSDARQAGFKRDTLMAAGLIGESESKDGRKFIYNRFTNRLVFPIRDVAGRVRGFAGRHLDPASKKKYINSAEGEVFKKSKLLYGIERLSKSKALTSMKAVIVAEGYTDVQRLHWLGIDNAVAPMGTSITSDQVNLISRYAKDAYLLLDGDAAGIAAAVKAVPLFLTGGVTPHVIVMPDGLDPDEFIRGYTSGPALNADTRKKLAHDEIQTMLSDRQNCLEFTIKVQLGVYGDKAEDPDWEDLIAKAPAESLLKLYESSGVQLASDELSTEARELFTTLRDIAGLEVDRRDREVTAVRRDIGNTWEDRQMMMIFRALAPYERTRLLRAGARLIVSQERDAKELGYPKPRQPWPDPAAIRRGGPVPGERKRK